MIIKGRPTSQALQRLSCPVVMDASALGNANVLIAARHFENTYHNSGVSQCGGGATCTGTETFTLEWAQPHQTRSNRQTTNSRLKSGYNHSGADL
eukprot:4789776-Amphidinium_carterae.1